MADPVRTGARNDLTDVAGIAVGHHQRSGRGWLTGTTVVLPPPGTVGGVDVRGGGPATRDTDALAPTTLVDRVDAVCLTGGSAYGLDAAGGVMAWLEEWGRGWPVGPEVGQVVPIVPTAALFDLLATGSPAGFGHRPDAAFGRRAAAAARPRAFAQGSVGAGTGARAGGLKGGIGSASAVLADGSTVAALVAVNAAGSVFDPRTGALWGARLLLPGEPGPRRRPTPHDLRAHRDLLAEAAAGTAGSPGPVGGPDPFNTTLVVLATDAALTKPECVRLAGAGHDGMARAISPVHGYTDGDLVIALATGALDLSAVRSGTLAQPATSRLGRLGLLFAAGADAVSRAIVHAVLAATSAGELVSYAERFPGTVDPTRRADRR